MVDWAGAAAGREQGELHACRAGADCLRRLWGVHMSVLEAEPQYEVLISRVGVNGTPKAGTGPTLRKLTQDKTTGTTEDDPDGFWSIARAGLLGAAPLTPLAASALAVAMYIHPQFGDFTYDPPSLVSGALDLIGAWVLLAVAFVALGFTDVRRANTTAYCELANMLTEVKGMEDALFSESPDGVKNLYECFPGSAKRACDQFKGYRHEAECALRGHTWARSAWVQGSGYVRTWRLLHRAEEVLIGVEPPSSLIERANFDLQRLAGSTIENRALLAERLAQAITILGPCAAAQAQQSVVRSYGSLEGKISLAAESVSRSTPALVGTVVTRFERSVRHLKSSNTSRPAEAGAATTAESSRFGVPLTPSNPLEARLVVGAVRGTLNLQHDCSCDGLVRARTRLACTTVATAIIAYVVLWLAIAAHVEPRPQLLSAVAYFLVGGLTGLFARQYVEFGSETATDDFGLSHTRLFAAPQLSGVAAIVGVGLLALAERAMEVAPADTLLTAFNMPAVPGNLVVAAIFGLTPGLLIDRLKQQTDVLRSNLRQAEPHQTPSSRA